MTISNSTSPACSRTASSPNLTSTSTTSTVRRSARGDAAGLAGFEHDSVRPFGDAIETLASWSAPNASDEIAADDFAEVAEWDAPPAPHVSPFRSVGRNDPCPCGSGKKYKKCCLSA